MYFFNTTSDGWYFDLWGGTFNWTGEDNGQFGNYNTVLWFNDPTKTGFIVQFHNTDGFAGVSNRDGVGADGTIFRGLSLISNAGLTHNYLTDTDGIMCRARATVENCKIFGFARCGFLVCATSNLAAGGNANCSYIDRSSLYWNGSHGIMFIGADSNAGGAHQCDCSDNGEWGYLDLSFLGNTFENCHASGNGITFYSHGNPDGWRCGCLVNHSDGHSYFATLGASDATFRATTPGTNELIWETYSKNYHPGYARTWDPTSIGNYTSGGSYGAYNANSFSYFAGSYAEGAQSRVQFLGAV